MFIEVGLEVVFAAHRGTGARARRPPCTRARARTRGRASTPEVGAEQLDRESCTRRRAAASRFARMPPTVPIGRPSMCVSCDASWRMRNVSPAAPMSGSPTASDADLVRPPSMIPLEQHRRHARARRRCCRSRTPSRRAAAATTGRRRARADRGWRWRTRRDSGGGAAAGRDSASRPPRDRAWS